ncbi:NAD-binding protein [Pelomyxa schiedti]|nr:NAD-binding protein [Pelomyxa schiedti]
MRVAFIGLGVMGKSMSMHLIKAGHELFLYSRRDSSATDAVAAGGKWCNTIKQAVSNAEVVITMVGFPKDVEEVYLSPGGIVESATPGTLLIDMTTTKPSLAVAINEAALHKGIKFLDAPVSGGDVGARNAALSIMVGGDQATFEQARPIFEKLGKTIVLQGPCGSGQHTKMCNQIAIASGMIGVMESLVYARNAGLNPETVLSSISTGAAASWSLANYTPRVLAGNFAPGFFVEHFIKDMDIALEEAHRMGLELPGLALARKMYEDVVKLGGAKLGTQSLFIALEPPYKTRDKLCALANSDSAQWASYVTNAKNSTPPYYHQELLSSALAACISARASACLEHVRIILRAGLDAHTIDPYTVLRAAESDPAALRELLTAGAPLTAVVPVLAQLPGPIASIVSEFSSH